MTIEGSGSVSLTNGSGFGSGRTQNIWILRSYVGTLAAVLFEGRIFGTGKVSIVGSSGPVNKLFSFIGFLFGNYV
jgi:hypothetical protein